MGGPEGPHLSADELQGLHEQKEESEAQELPVEQLVEQSNAILDAHADQFAELGEEFTGELHDNVVQYFLTSAERFNTDTEVGLDLVEFQAYATDMLAKLEGILEQYAPTEEQLEAKEKQKEAAQEAKAAAESVESLELASLDFDMKNLSTPEGLQTEFEKFNQRGQDLAEKMGKFMTMVTGFSQAYQKFEAAKQEWSIIGRSNGFFGLNIGARDKETDFLVDSLRPIKKHLNVAMQDVQAEVGTLELYGKAMNDAPEKMKEKALAVRNKKVEELEGKRDELSGSREKQNEKRGVLQEQQANLTDERDDLTSYMQELREEIDSAREAKDEMTSKKDQFAKGEGQLKVALQMIDRALGSRNLSPEQKKTFQARREKLVGQQKAIQEGAASTDDLASAATGAAVGMEDVYTELEGAIGDISNYLDNTINPALAQVEASLQALETMSSDLELEMAAV